MKYGRERTISSTLAILTWVGYLLLAYVPSFAQAAVLPPTIEAALTQGKPQIALVAFDSRAIDASAAKQRAPRSRFDDPAVLAFKAREYSALKQRSQAWTALGDTAIALDYSHLPIMLVRFQTLEAARKYAAHKEVLGIYEDLPLYPTLAQSLPLIGQSSVVNAGLRGNGTTVVVLDSGVNYALADFGSCSAPAIPSSCRVVVAGDLAANDATLDDSGHGTNVSGIVAATAPGASLAVFDVFSGTSANSSTIVTGINWAIANQAAYNIVAINMSFGDTTRYTSPCASSATNPFLTPIAGAYNAGILSVVSAGNNTYTDGITSPACTPYAISVGAVYDTNVGAISYTGLCTESGTTADKVACFSNSANFLTLLAPGALITSGGATQAGTSQAAPHVAGAVAVLRAEFTEDTLEQIVARMVNSGTSVLDGRNGLSKPRLNMVAAARPGNDAFTTATLLSSASGQITSSNTLASKQIGEPNHAGNTGGTSVWFTWTASSSGPFTFTTQGSSFDTLLAIYQGTAVATLTPIASNNDDGTAGNASSVTIDAIMGQTYVIAVDGNNGMTGAIVLTWSNTPIDSAEIPVLPPWGVVAMLLSLAAIGLKNQGSRNRRKRCGAGSRSVRSSRKCAL